MQGKVERINSKTKGVLINGVWYNWGLVEKFASQLEAGDEVEFTADQKKNLSFIRVTKDGAGVTPALGGLTTLPEAVQKISLDETLEELEAVYGKCWNKAKLFVLSNASGAGPDLQTTCMKEIATTFFIEVNKRRRGE